MMPQGSMTGAMQTVIGRRQGQSNVFDLFAGSVNGGVWRSTNFEVAMIQGGVSRAAGIRWQPLTDAAPSLSIGCLAFDPNDPAGNTLWAGTGQFSSSPFGGPAVGLLKTINARAAVPIWQVLGNQAAQPGDVSLVGQRIVSVVPTMLIDRTTGGQVVLAASFDGQGVLRSTNGGTTFQQALTGFATDLIADPNNSNVFYAALRATYDNQNALVTQGGVVRSMDGGRTWTAIDLGIPRATRSKSIKLGIFNNSGGRVANVGSTVLYAVIADTSGNTNNLIGVFRCQNPRDSMPVWNQIFFDPNPNNIPQGLAAGQWPAAAAVPWCALAIDPLNWNLLFLGGMSWLYKVNVTVQQGGTLGTNWSKWDEGSFFDHRSMTYLTDQVLLSTGDQGVYALQDPGNRLPWVSLNNTIAVTELYSAAYNPALGFVFGGAQDLGTPSENAYGGWNLLPDGGGDGGVAFAGVDGTFFYEVNGSFKRSAPAWGTEEDLGGVLTTPPSACTWGPGRVDAFYRGQNTHLWHRWFEGSWSAEEDLMGGLTSAPSACTWGPGRVDIFYRGQNNHLWHRWFDGGWHAEEDLMGGLTSAPGACTWGPGRIDIFYRGQNNHLWHRWFDGGWHAEEDLGGVLTSAPSACTWGPGRIDIFYRGQNNHLWHRWFEGVWHAEEDLGGFLTSDPAACTWGPGRVDIFYRGQNGHLFHRWFDGGWQTEEDLGGVLDGSPGACSWFPGRMDVFYGGQNKHLFHRSFERAGGSVTPAAVPTVGGPRRATVSPVDGKRMLVVAGNRLVESRDRGDSVTDVTPQGLSGSVSAMAYATDVAHVAYVGSTTGQMFLRQNVNGVFASLPNYPGNRAQVDDIAVDASDWRRAVTISNDGRILMTVDGGVQWVNLRGNAGTAITFMRCIVLVKAGADTVLLIGGDPAAGKNGVVRTINPTMNQANPNIVWSEFGTGLPRAQVLDLQYYPPRMLQTGDPGGDVVVAGTLGRGAWTIENATRL